MSLVVLGGTVTVPAILLYCMFHVELSAYQIFQRPSPSKPSRW